MSKKQDNTLQLLQSRIDLLEKKIDLMERERDFMTSLITNSLHHRPQEQEQVQEPVESSKTKTKKIEETKDNVPLDFVLSLSRRRTIV